MHHFYAEAGYPHFEKKNIEKAMLNVDGSYNQATGGGALMVLRDQAGQVIYASCRQFMHCRNTTEAELVAIEEGLRLVMYWTSSEFAVEMDCAEALELVKDGFPNLSAYTFQINDIRDLLRERVTRMAKINREANVVSH
jgi:hypothetical protein